MKTSKNKFMMALATFACALLIAVMPMFAVVAHAGDNSMTTTSVANVSANGVDVSAQDANAQTPVSYSIDVRLDSAYVSSFEMSIRMPSFVDVTAVQESATLARMDANGVFEYNVDNRGYVNVAYSSAVDFSGITLFTVVFTVNDYTEQYEVIECASCQFVNSDIQEIYANVDLGYVAIDGAESTVMGDVNGDNVVNLADLLIIQRSIVNPDYALTEEQFTVADIDKNGEINIIDCQYIQNYLVGKIDSLENVGQSSYTVGVLINDQNGNMLYQGSFEAQSGVLYAEYMTPIFMELSKTYNITGNLSINSKVYGAIDPESSGDGFVIKGDDEIVMVVNVEENSGEEKKIVYSYSFGESYTDGTNAYINMELYADGTMKASNTLYDTDGNVLNDETVYATWVQHDNLIDVTIAGATQTLFRVQEDGSIVPYENSEEEKAIVYTYHYAFATEDGVKVEFDYTFYNDGTVLGVEFENGVNTGEYWVNWTQDGQYIDIMFDGETERMFVVNGDGSLSMYQGGGSDVEEPVKIMDYNLSMHELSVACGTSQDALLKELTSAYLTLYYSNGTSEQVAVTADMLDIENVLLDMAGTYNAFVNFNNEEMGFGVQMVIRVTVLPDTSNWTYIDTFTFVFDGENMFEFETFVFYAEAIVIDGEEFCQWTANENGVVEMVYEGVTVLMQLNADEKTIAFYQPSDALIGAYTFTQGDMQMVFSVYGQYGGAKDYVTCVTQTMIGDAGAVLRVNYTVYVQLDLENGILYPSMIGREFTINEDNTLTMKECEHEWVTETQAPTCTQEGYERQWCSKCGQGMGTVIEKLDHSYDENGVCGNCGAVAGEDTDPELQNYKTMRLDEMANVWMETVNKYCDYDVPSAYGEQFNHLCETVDSATNYSVVDKYYELFHQMIAEIHAKFGSGGGDVVVDDYVNRISWGVDAIGIPVGSAPSVLMEKVVGTTFEVTYSQSGLVQYTVTEDMVNYGEVVFDTEGAYEVTISFTANDGCMYNHNFTVIITPDMSEVELVGAYKVSVPEYYEMGFDEITLYANGIAFMNGGYYVDIPTDYYVYKENVVAVNMQGGYLVFVLENGVASFYDPATELETIGTYTMGNAYMSVTVIVYGEYTGAGDYVSTMIAQDTDENGNIMTMTIATVSYLDMENCEFRHVMFGEGKMKYDEKGNLYCPHEETRVESWDGDCWNNGWRREYCTNCGEEMSYETIPASHNYDENGVCTRCGNGGSVEETFDVSEFFARMKMEWSNLDNQYNITEEYYARYNDLIIRLQETTSYDEAKMIYSKEFQSLCREVMANCEGEEVQTPSIDSDYIYNGNGSVSVIA